MQSCGATEEITFLYVINQLVSCSSGKVECKTVRRHKRAKLDVGKVCKLAAAESTLI